jgi:hypothetical protein
MHFNLEFKANNNFDTKQLVDAINVVFGVNFSYNIVDNAKSMERYYPMASKAVSNALSGAEWCLFATEEMPEYKVFYKIDQKRLVFLLKALGLKGKVAPFKAGENYDSEWLISTGITFE